MKTKRKTSLTLESLHLPFIPRPRGAEHAHGKKEPGKKGRAKDAPPSNE